MYTEIDNTHAKPLHNLDYTVKKIFKCFVCKRTFKTDTIHKNVLVNKGPTVCHHCGRDCSTLSFDLNSHVDKCICGEDNKGNSNFYKCPHYS